MPQSRRQFLKRLAEAAGPGLALPLLAGSCRRAASGEGMDPRTADVGSASPDSAAGAQRTVAGLRLRWCPPGSFLMGSPADEHGRRADEAQVHVTHTRGFWIGAVEVTQGEWRRVVGDFPGRQPSEQYGLGDTFPAYWVTHGDAEHFCGRLTDAARIAGELGDGHAFMLPTEAQWEYACRAGTTTATAFGPVLEPHHANFGGGPSADITPGEAPGRATPVGTYAPNPWGIHDMHGNVFEWCRDWYHARLPGGTDPDLSGQPGVQNGDGTYSRVRRGGAWNDPAEFCRSALRLRYEPHRSSDHIGFRVVLIQL